MDALIAKFCKDDEKNYGTPPDKNPWNRPYYLGGTKAGSVAVFNDEIAFHMPKLNGQ